MVRNIMEIIVEEKFKEMLLKDTNFCGCPKCCEDVMALTLNNMAPNYVSSDRGTLYSKAKMLTSEREVEVIKLIAIAMKKVSESPQH